MWPVDDAEERYFNPFAPLRPLGGQRSEQYLAALRDPTSLPRGPTDDGWTQRLVADIAAQRYEEARARFGDWSTSEGETGTEADDEADVAQSIEEQVDADEIATAGDQEAPAALVAGTDSADQTAPGTKRSAPSDNENQPSAKRNKTTTTNDHSPSAATTTRDLPVEVWLFDETQPAKLPWTYILTPTLPTERITSPKTLINATLAVLDNHPSLAPTAPSSDPFVGNVLLYGTFHEKGRKLQQRWHMSTRDMVREFVAAWERREEDEVGARDAGDAEVKVMLWKRGDAVKARRARKERLPERVARAVQ